MRQEEAHAQLVGQGEGLAVVTFSLSALRRLALRCNNSSTRARSSSVVVLRGDGTDQVVEKRGNLLEVLKDEVARQHCLAPGPALQGL